MHNPFYPPNNQDLRQIVYEKIKEEIITGAIRPGEKLSEVELAERFSVSRTPVREAIRQLAKTSLVTLTPHKGAHVTQLSIADAADLYELREDLEMLAAALTCAHPPARELKAFLEIFQNMDNSTPVQEYLRQDRRFHSLIYQASGNRFLMNSLMGILDMINLYRPYSIDDPDCIKKLSDGHVNIIEAMFINDVSKVREVMSEHIRLSRIYLETALKSHKNDADGQALTQHDSI